jgi:hypothetical protein
MNRSTLNAPAVIGNLVESSHCVRGKTETASHYLLDCQQLTTPSQ